MPANPETLKLLCDLVAEGMSIAKACETLGLAAPSVRRWSLEDSARAKDDPLRTGFGDELARAVELGCEALAENTLQLVEAPLTEDERADRKAAMAHRRLIVDTRMRLVGVWNRKRFGQHQQVDAQVSAAVSVVPASPEDENL